MCSCWRMVAHWALGSLPPSGPPMPSTCMPCHYTCKSFLVSEINVFMEWQEYIYGVSWEGWKINTFFSYYYKWHHPKSTVRSMWILILLQKYWFFSILVLKYFLSLFKYRSYHFKFMHCIWQRARGLWHMAHLHIWLLIHSHGFRNCSSCRAQFYQCYGSSPCDFASNFEFVQKFGCRVQFYQCYVSPLILSSPFQHLLPNQLLGRHHIFSSTNSKFNDM